MRAKNARLSYGDMLFANGWFVAYRRKVMLRPTRATLNGSDQVTRQTMALYRRGEVRAMLRRTRVLRGMFGEQQGPGRSAVPACRRSPGYYTWSARARA